MIFLSISVFPFLALAVANNEDARTQLVKGNEQFTANMFNVSKVLDLLGRIFTPILLDKASQLNTPVVYFSFRL